MMVLLSEVLFLDVADVVVVDYLMMTVQNFDDESFWTYKAMSSDNRSRMSTADDDESFRE